MNRITTRTRRRIHGIILVASLVTLLAPILLFDPATAVSAHRPELSAEWLIVGKWRQTFGPYTTESVFQSDGSYSAITTGQFTPCYFSCVGKWEIKQGMLVTHYRDCSPREVRRAA